LALVTLSDLTIRFRGPALLDGVHCLIEPGERIGLLGRNGAGKSTLMSILTGAIEPDHGTVSFSPGARAVLLPQEVPRSLHGTVADVVRSGVQPESLHSNKQPADPGDVDHENLWKIDHQVEQILSRMQLDPEGLVDKMSSGMKRRVLLARVLVNEPQLLLLDEPTNHLDLQAIEWLENYLLRWRGTLMFVTHDRQFLRRLATRILEIEGGRLFDWSCDYDTFQRRKEEALAAEEKQNALFDKKLAEEEVWIRQGIKARRTRNEGRVRALEKLRLIRGERRVKTGTSNLQIQQVQRSGNLVAHLEEVCFAHPTAGGSTNILTNFSTTIMRGDKVGIIGPNGSGKTTFLKIVMGELKPSSGKVRLGTNLHIAYFDQLRQQLDENKTVQEDVADGYDTISIDGQHRHVLGYLQDFLFTPERARTLIGRLSGGERNRVLLAKLFAKPANVIVLDEPTNDLDTETLEMLESRLVDTQATLLIVSHDREFLNNVVTSTIAFELGEDGSRRVTEAVGGYDDWLQLQQRRSSGFSDSQVVREQTGKSTDEGSSSGKLTIEADSEATKRLSFKEQQELQKLPSKIEELDRKIAELHVLMASVDFYKSSGDEIARQQARLSEFENRLAGLCARWDELEARS
jgi:ATP-binding cassette subfamily F protein uup